MTVDFSKLQPFVEATVQFKTGQPLPHAVAKDDVEPVGVQHIPSHFADKPEEYILDSAFSPQKCVLILSPFMAEDPGSAMKMIRYATRCIQDSLTRNEAAISTNLFYYDTLNIKVAIERDKGLKSMISWTTKADIIAVYIDHGVTQAMQVVINTAQMRSKKIEYRTISQQ